MNYTREIQVEFNHCDPAGIVFYPRYFEMTNSVIENFFADVVEKSFAAIHTTAGSGIPVVSIDAKFVHPSRLGEKILFAVTISKLGQSSATFEIVAAVKAQKRLHASITVVWMENWKAHNWPLEMQKALQKFMENAA